MSSSVKLFKPNDVRDQKFNAIFDDLFNEINADYDTFFNQGYSSYLLADIIWDNKLDPVTNVLTREVYQTSFNAIHKLFTRPATFEFFIDVFRAMWGADVTVIFTIIKPGQLKIEILGSTPEYNEILYREVVGGSSYIYDEIITQDGDSLTAQESAGPQTIEDLLMIMSELGANGIYYSPLVLITDPSEEDGMLITEQQSIGTGGLLTLPSSKGFYVPVIGTAPGENVISGALFSSTPLDGSRIILSGKSSTNVVVLKSGLVDWSLQLHDDMYLTNNAKIELLVNATTKRLEEISRRNEE